MGIWNTLKSNNFFTNYFDLKKSNKIMMDGMLRPSSSPDYFRQSGHIYPRFPFGNYQLYDFAYNSDTLTSIHNSLRRELFRNGYDLVVAKKTDETITTSEAETTPKGKTKEQILEFLERVNDNRQSMMDVLMEIEDDFSIMDDGFMVFLFTYEFDDSGKLIKRELNQVLRGDPRFMGPMLNRYDRPAYNDEDVPLFFCPRHRENLLEGDQICNCGTQKFPAFYFKDYQGARVYYSKWEVIFKSKYRPSIRRGFSPVITVWQKARTLLFMDKYIMQLYDGQRPPKYGLFFKTSNQKALEKAMTEAKQKLRTDPHWPFMMAVPDSSNGRSFIEFIDFMKSLDELQHTEMRNEFRRQIGAVYGVEPIFQGDISTSGGLNNEGLQLTVTNRAIEYGQGIYNKHFLPEILKAMGVEGWSILLNPSEEQDEMAKLTRQSQSLANGQMALQLGLEAEYDEDTGEVIIKPGELEQQQQEPGGEGFFDPPPGKPFRPTGAPSIGQSMSSELQKARKRPNFSKMSDTIKKEIDKFFRKFKRKPTEKELEKAVKEINSKLQKELKESTRKLFKNTYVKEADKVGKELGINVLFSNIDETALSVLANQDVLTKAYADLSFKITTKLNDLIKEAYLDPKGLSTQKITEQIKDVSDVADFRAENIARTETSKVSSAARKTSYAKEEDFDNFLFKWIGPNDNRTTDTSKRIKARTNKGVPWAELVNIVTQESKKDFPEWTVDKDYPVSHYSSRHSFLKIS